MSDSSFLLPPSSLSGFADEQSRMNQSTRGAWDWYANYRRHVERLIIPRDRGGRICVLGAGNCNDLDLTWLIEAFAEVHLIDIDPAALNRAAHRQGVNGHPKLVLHAPLDLTGIADRMAGWKGRNVTDAELTAAVEAALAISQPIVAGGFDVVLSPCVLSQLLCGVRDVIGKSHPGWPRLKAALRSRHLRDLAGLCAPDGRGVLVVDLASSNALPGLDRARDEELPDLMRMCARDGKCFRGLEPRELAAAIRGDKALNRIVSDTSISQPWLWHLGWGKAFLVYGMTVRRTYSSIPL